MLQKDDYDEEWSTNNVTSGTLHLVIRMSKFVQQMWVCTIFTTLLYPGPVPVGLSAAITAGQKWFTNNCYNTFYNQVAFYN